jgi:hypothetical protein
MTNHRVLARLHAHTNTLTTKCMLDSPVTQISTVNIFDVHDQVEKKIPDVLFSLFKEMYYITGISLSVTLVM